MFNAENIKLLVISTITLAACIQARSISQIGDIRIEKSSDKWLCDMIDCPLNSDRCFVSKSNEEEPSILKRVNICYSRDNTILAQKTISSAIDPNYHIRQYINSYHSGTTFTTSDHHAAQTFDENMFNEYMARKMLKLQTNLHKIHDDIDSNIQNQMHYLEKSLGNMQYNLEHMFS